MVSRCLKFPIPTVALLTGGLDARYLAPLTLVDSLLGVAGPALALTLARRGDPTRVLVTLLVVQGVVVCVLFLRRDLFTLLALYVVLDLLDDIWDPIALAQLQGRTPSARRATVSSVVYQLGAGAQLLGLGAFATLLGAYSEELRDATPDLLSAFSGVTEALPEPSVVALGLPVAELALVAFLGLGVLAAPLVAASRARDRRPSAS